MIEVDNPYLPANHQDIDNISSPEDGSYMTFSHYGRIRTRLEKPCFNHRVAFPSNDIKLYPEIRTMPYYLCEKCGWFVSSGRE